VILSGALAREASRVQDGDEREAIAPCAKVRRRRSVTSMELEADPPT